MDTFHFLSLTIFSSPQNNFEIFQLQTCQAWHYTIKGTVDTARFGHVILGLAAQHQIYCHYWRNLSFLCHRHHQAVIIDYQALNLFVQDQRNVHRQHLKVRYIE